MTLLWKVFACKLYPALENSLIRPNCTCDKLLLVVYHYAHLNALLAISAAPLTMAVKAQSYFPPTSHFKELENVWAIYFMHSMTLTAHLHSTEPHIPKILRLFYNSSSHVYRDV